MENIKPTFETPTEEDFNATKADEQALNKSQNLRKAGLLATGLVRFGMAMAGGTEDPDQKLNDTFHEEFSKNNIEATSQLQTEPIPDATTGFYSENLSMYEPEPFVETEFESNDEMFSFKSNLSFQTDKAEIPPDGQEKITEGAHNFLASITPENFDQIINSEWNLMGSSDERPTNAWGEEGNEALTQARLNEMFDIFDKARDEYDFSKSGLTTEQIEELLTKKINLLMPEGGVTHVTDLINPKTGETFTEEEVENLKRNDKQQYALLLQQARFVAFNIEGEVEPVEKPQLAKEELPETNLEEEPVFAFEKVSTVDFIKGLEKYSFIYFCS
jgi:hypothetical protein